uniref:Uncharacterized protein n=1 Tax=Spironucleus salmonicida TaxID=348837 RepID=V6LK30_9EUKA|eukprot:EST44907.1 Hypothetical protein SS50377_15201 [Spironucleus salmonicida]
MGAEIQRVKDSIDYANNLKPLEEIQLSSQVCDSIQTLASYEVMTLQHASSFIIEFSDCPDRIEMDISCIQDII